MNFGSFWVHINYSNQCPEGVSLQRWLAMLNQWFANKHTLSATFAQFKRPDDESPDSWDYEWAKALRRSGKRCSFYSNPVGKF